MSDQINRAASGGGMSLKRSSLLAAAVLAALMAAALPLALVQPSGVWLTRYLLIYQDALIACAVILLLARPAEWQIPRLSLPGDRMSELVTISCLALICWVGSRVVFQGYDLSRDEQLANFDAAIYARGAVFQQLPAAWRQFADSLNQTFMLPVGNREGWVSAYLPVNAGLRAAVGTIDANLTSPLLAGIGALALLSIARRIWPDSPRTRLVVLLLYAGSSQILVTGMTAYAMTGHLALNLLWLALFLRGERLSHGGAIFVGTLATGLHQPLFHPLFVLPFFSLMLQRKQYRLLAVYVTAYTAIAMIWLAWPLWISAHATTVMPPKLNMEGVGYLDRLVRGAEGFSLGGIGLMAANLTRFIAWQHMLALPLAIIGVASCWKGDAFVRALVLGLLLPVIAMLLLLPYQGHGWGYRYLHGVIGNLVLLGGYGWRACERHGADNRAPMLATTMFSMLVLFPIHAWIAHRQAMPYIELDRAISASGASVLIVDDDAAPFAKDLVINRADLSNRPTRLRASAIDPAAMTRLCRFGSIAFLDGNRMQATTRYFDMPAATTTQAQLTLRQAAAQLACKVKPLR